MSAGGGGNPGSRLYALAKEREERAKARTSARDPRCTFSPSISARSAALVLKDKEDGKDANADLYTRAMQERVRKEAEVKVKQLAGCTFSPQITKRAEALVRPGSAGARLHDPGWLWTWM